MVSKKMVMVFLLIGVLFIYGCEGGQTVSSLQGAYANCFGDNTQMISAAFESFAPVSSEENPYEPGEEIDITVVFESFYTEDIEENNVKARLTGDAALENIFSGASIQNGDTLYGIDTETCLTEDTELDIGPIIYQGDITTKVSKEITGLYCYAQPVVVKGYLYFTEDSTEIGENLPSGSNPPSSVQVTQIEQNPVDVDRDDNSGDMRFKIYLQNLGTGTIVESLDDCFGYRDTGYDEEFHISVTGAYDTIECPETVKLSRDERTDVVTCKITGIDVTNLGDAPSEITITLDEFAYEDEIPSTTIWLEP